MKFADISEVIAANAQHNERNACTVIAVSNGAGLPYHVAHEMMAKAGRQPRHGFYFSQWMNFGCRRAEVSGEPFTLGAYKVTRVNLYAAGFPTLNQVSRDFKRGRFILCTRNHALAMIDGVIYDNAGTGARARIKNMYYLTDWSEGWRQYE